MPNLQCLYVGGARKGRPTWNLETLPGRSTLTTEFEELEEIAVGMHFHRDPLTRCWHVTVGTRRLSYKDGEESAATTHLCLCLQRTALTEIQAALRKQIHFSPRLRNLKSILQTQPSRLTRPSQLPLLVPFPQSAFLFNVFTMGLSVSRLLSGLFGKKEMRESIRCYLPPNLG